MLFHMVIPCCFMAMQALTHGEENASTAYIVFYCTLINLGSYKRCDPINCCLCPLICPHTEKSHSELLLGPPDGPLFGPLFYKDSEFNLILPYITYIKSSLKVVSLNMVSF